MSSIVTIVPTLDLNQEHKDVILEGAADVTLRQWQSTNYSNTSVSFTCPPPSMSTFIDRCIMLTIPVVVTYTGTTTGAALLQNGCDALRAYPLSSILTNSTVNMNNQQFNIQSKEVIPYIAHYFHENKHTTYPSFLDKTAVYADMGTAINNPLGSYFNSVDGWQPRGGFPATIVNGATSATLTATIIEPVFVPPLHINFEDSLGFSNVKTMDFVFNFSSNLSRIVSHAASNATITNIAVQINQPLLTMKYYSPKAGYVPRPLRYGSQEIVVQPTQSNVAIASNASQTMVSSNIQLNCIPSHMYIFVREANANLTYTTSDTFCNISNVNITFNNVTGILSSASPVDLYNIAKSNGLRDSWEEWQGFTTILGGNKIGTVGSMLKLCFGKDITLRSDDWVGKQGPYNLQVIVTATNYNQSASILNPTLVIIPVTPSTLIIHETGDIEKRLGVTLGDSATQYVPYHNVVKHYGGSFMDVVNKISGFLRPLNEFIKKHKVVSSVASMIPHPVSQAVASVARQYGYGEDGEDGGSGEEGGVRTGGRVMSRKQLKERLRKM